MTLAPLAILFVLDTLRVCLFVLFGRVITALALGAGQGDQCSHLILLLTIKRRAAQHIGARLPMI
jgi:hypothetical protein